MSRPDDARTGDARTRDARTGDGQVDARAEARAGLTPDEESEAVVAHKSFLGQVTAGLWAARSRARGVPGGAIALRIVVTIVGILVIAVGVVLLPLPGPGWLIIFAGMGLLATEYAWAARLLRRTRSIVLGWTRWSMSQNLAVRMLIGLLGLLFLGALAVGSIVLMAG